MVLNAAANASPDIFAANEATASAITAWKEQHQHANFSVHVIRAEALPPKHAGVGWARKIGMDEAAMRLEQAGHPDGIIVCFDADSQCTPNLLVAIADWFDAHPQHQALSVHFEHPLEGNDFEPEVYEGIVLYELFLRYYLQAQRWAGHPHAIHTIGSSMAVRAGAYLEQGGMNRRKAGEDFYFLQKFIQLGRCGELSMAHVIPSPRPSDRVPFGTGKAVRGWLDGTQQHWPAYAPDSIVGLQQFIAQLPKWYRASASEMEVLLAQLPTAMARFLTENGVPLAAEDASRNSPTAERFAPRFFQWFNAFRVLKYVHYARDYHCPEIDLLKAAGWLLGELGVAHNAPVSATELLNAYRALDCANG